MPMGSFLRGGFMAKNGFRAAGGDLGSIACYSASAFICRGQMRGAGIVG